MLDPERDSPAPFPAPRERPNSCAKTPETVNELIDEAPPPTTTTTREEAFLPFVEDKLVGTIGAISLPPIATRNDSRCCH